MSTGAQILDAVRALGGTVFTAGGTGSKLHNANIVVERRLPETVNTYDDVLWFIAQDEKGWYYHRWVGTADPGLPALLAHKNPNGTGIVQPGFYRGCYKIGVHGPHRVNALVQQYDRDPIRLWRDRNDDGRLDRTGKTYTDGRGVNIHPMGNVLGAVGFWSEACMGTMAKHWPAFWSDVTRSAAIYGPRFSFSLVEMPK